MKDMLRHLSAKTGAGDDQSLVVLLEQPLVDPGLVVKSGREGLGRHLDQIVVSLLIFCQYDEVVTAAVLNGALILPTIPGTVALAAEDWLEYFPPLLLDLLPDFLLNRRICLLCQPGRELLDLRLNGLIDFVAVIMQSLDTIHHAVVGQSHTALTVLPSRLYEVLDRRCPVKDGEVGVDVEVYEGSQVCHFTLLS